MAGSSGPGPYYAMLARNQLWYKQFLQRAGTVDDSPTSTAATFNVQYVGSTKWTAVAAWAATTGYSVGNLVRQLATPTVNFERVFVCLTAGTSGGSEPLWSTPATAPDYRSVWTDGTVVWRECTGQSAYGWNAPHARLANAITVPWCTPGDWVYVSNHHAETQATTMSITLLNSAVVTNIICVNDAGSVPPVAADVTTGATVNTTGTVQINLVSNGNASAYINGIAFNCGTSANPVFQILTNFTIGWVRFENCQLNLGTGTTSGQIIMGGASNSQAAIELINTTMAFQNAGATVTIKTGYFSWINTPSAVNGTAPTVLINPSNAQNTVIKIDGVDLSAMGSGKSLFLATAAFKVDVAISNCKLGSGVSVTSGSISGAFGFVIDMVNCDSANTNYRYYKQNYYGTITHETTAVRTGGASDGTTPISRKMVSTANSKFFSPLESDPIIYWNESLSPITLTVPIVVDAGGIPALFNGLTNQDCWIEVEYQGTSGFPLGVWSTQDKASNLLSVPTAQPIDNTSVWANVLARPVQQSLSTTFTPTGKGPISVKVMLARPSTTVYFDPKVVASARQWPTLAGHVNEGGGGGKILASSIIEGLGTI